MAQAVEQATSDKILWAAREIFADKGYAGARVDEIARAAGVNKATLYYQIGDKEALYHVVVTGMLRGIADRLDQELDQSGDPSLRLQQYVTLFARLYEDGGSAARIMLREVADGGRNLPEQAVRQMGRILGHLTEIIEAGQAQGGFRETNPFMVHMLVVGSLNFYVANEPIRRRNVERNPEIFNPAHFLTTEEASRQVADLILAAVTQPNPDQ